MMTVLDQATRRRAVQAVSVLLLLTFSFDALASDSPNSGNIKSRKCSPDVKVHDRTERKLAAVPAPEPAVSGNAPAPRPSNRPPPPPPPPNSRSALISPRDDTPGTDLPPRILSPPPASEAPRTSPTLESKPPTWLLILPGCVVALSFLILVGLAALAIWRPEWLRAWCGPRGSSKITPDDRDSPL